LGKPPDYKKRKFPGISEKKPTRLTLNQDLNGKEPSEGGPENTLLGTTRILNNE